MANSLSAESAPSMESVKHNIGLSNSRLIILLKFKQIHSTIGDRHAKQGLTEWQTV